MQGKEIEEKFIKPDLGAKYYKEIRLDLGKIEPMVALPGDPRNGIPLSKLGERKINNVYIGSCTGGNLDDLAEVARELEGKKIAEGVKMNVQAASEKILEEAGRLGYLDTIAKSGAEIISLGCGACIGLGPGSIPDLAEEDVESYVTVSATNRNFTGRMGGRSPIYLTSPVTAAKAAINGKIGG
jgi:3-isopropylmalate/(R)-2-methylmalate dehydratase large subunit